VQSKTAIAPPLLRESLPELSRAGKLAQMAVVVQEAITQQPLIWQGRHSFVHQFDWTLAPYSGCQMGCGYCYVPEILFRLPDKLGGWGNYVHVRSRSVELLARQLDEMDGTSGFVSATTDPYQKVEGQYRLTRQLLEKLIDSRVGFVLISTRGTLVLRDLDILSDARMKGRIEVGISIPSDLGQVHAALEPYTPAFKGRFAVARKLRDAGVPVRIHAAPLALSTPDFFRAAADAADWLWVDKAEHKVEEDLVKAPWLYREQEVLHLVEEAKACAQLGALRVGYGRDQFGWRWHTGQGCIVPPPPRVRWPKERAKGKPHG